MTLPDVKQLMRELLDRQIRALEQVLKALAEEEEALNNRDADALEASTRQKQQALDAVDKLEQERMRMAPDLETMEMLAGAPEIASRWEKFLDLTRRCREKNNANGRMIRRQQRRVEGTLDLLRGTPSDRSVYGPDGDQPTETKTRPPIASV